MIGNGKLTALLLADGTVLVVVSKARLQELVRHLRFNYKNECVSVNTSKSVIIRIRMKYYFSSPHQAYGEAVEQHQWWIGLLADDILCKIVMGRWIMPKLIEPAVKWVVGKLFYFLSFLLCTLVFHSPGMEFLCINGTLGKLPCYILSPSPFSFFPGGVLSS